MKACPHCEAQLRDSVIKCTSCGRSLRGEPKPIVAAPSPAPATLVAPSAAPSPPAATASQPRVGQSTRHVGFSSSSMPEVVTRRALPSDRRRSGRPDAVLLLMSVVAAAAGVLAWRSMEEAWVQLTITDTSDRLDPVLVGAVTLRGKGALIGAIGQGLSAVLVGSGLLWLVYSFDRGSTMPWFTSPITAIVAGAAGVGASVLSALVWFVWEEAAIGRSSALGLTGDQFREILDRQPPPLVEIQRLTGLMRFGGMMLLGTLVASAAWWAYRKRA